MTRVAFYKTDKGQILCDPCSLKLCQVNHAVSMHRTYSAGSPLSFPTLVCEACGERHIVKQS